MTSLRIAVGQIEPRIGDLQWNIEQIQRALNQAADNNVDVLVLPELSNSGYAFASTDEALDSSEIIPEGDISRMLLEWSSDNKMVVAGICEKTNDGLFNSAAVIANGKHITTYRKIHLFYKEFEWFIPGGAEPPVIEFEGHRFGVMICFDWAFPEIARILALKGAQVILHPANLVLPYCFDAMITRSIENRVFTATANRIGVERDLNFTGRSQITSPEGKRLLSLSKEDAGMGMLEIDPSIADDKMITERNDVLADRRPELYRRLVEK